MRRARQILDRAERRSLVLRERDVEIGLLDWGGDGPLALLHHANGFCKGVWGLVADGLRERFRVVAMDARGHGDSSRPDGPDGFGWDAFALDLVAVAERLAAERRDGRVAVGVGHSFGGTAMIGAAARRPELFERIVLVDPVTPPRPELMPPGRDEHLQGLVDGARKRRADWPSREEARAWWAERELFAGWRPEALDLYALDGLGEEADGSVALKCPGAVEAAVFAGSEGFDIFARVRGVATPALFLWAARGSFPRSVYEELAASMRAARVETLDCGHMVPMERPEWVVEAVCRFAAEGA
jgi:pimeloyl-ACP methyl ester carboxylesterase